MVFFYPACGDEYIDVLSAELYPLLYLQDAAGKLPVAVGIAQRRYRDHQIGGICLFDRLVDGAVREGKNQVVGVINGIAVGDKR